MIKKTLLALVLLVCSIVSANAMETQFEYRGTIAGKQVVANISYDYGRSGGIILYAIYGPGYYYYTNKGKPIQLVMQDNYSNPNHIIYYEYSNGKYTGKWVLNAKDSGNGLYNTLRGTFYAPNGKTYPIKLRLKS